MLAARYLEGAVHEGLVQVDDHTVLAVVRYADLGQQELGWRLRRQKEQKTEKRHTGYPKLRSVSEGSVSEGSVPRRSCWRCDDGSVGVREKVEHCSSLQKCWCYRAPR